MRTLFIITVSTVDNIYTWKRYCTILYNYVIECCVLVNGQRCVRSEKLLMDLILISTFLVEK